MKKVQKKLIVTICIGEDFQKVGDVTHPRMKTYAEKIGADFKVIDEFDPQFSHAGFMKFTLGKFCEQYDRVLYLDTDILINDNAQDIFEVVPEQDFGAFNEGKHMERKKTMITFAQQYNEPNQFAMQEWIKQGDYFNTGVMVFSKTHSLALGAIPYQQIENFYEQTQLNFRLFTASKEHGFKFFELPHLFNRMSHMDKVSGLPRFEGHFIHYAGAGGSDGTRRTLDELISKDIEQLNKPIKRNIYINSGGGIGDVIASEPVIRYMIDELYTGDNIVIDSPFPEVFKHLKKRVKVKELDETLQDIGFYEFYLMPKKEHPSLDFISCNLCHPTDYASIMAFKGQLEMDRRCIQLETEDFEGMEKLKDHVLIHAGKGWASKTFPLEFWDDVVSTLILNRFKVALIGKTVNEGQGFVNLSGKGCLDLRDKLNLNQTFKAIHMAPVLISNDSMPIHAAGAFDNHIGLIASCKEPDRILPYRQRSQRYKTKVLSKGIIKREFRPTTLEEVRLDHATIEEVNSVLPEPREILEWLFTLKEEGEI